VQTPKLPLHVCANPGANCMASLSLSSRIHYARGRPSKIKERKVADIRYVLNIRLEEKSEQIKRKQEEAGCFVLLTNVPHQGDMAKAGLASVAINLFFWKISQQAVFTDSGSILILLMINTD
jgi:hypothetical protein